MLIHACILCQCHILFKCVCRKCYDGYAFSVRSVQTADHSGSLITTHDRHHQIHEDTVKSSRSRGRKCIYSGLSVVGSHDLCTCILKNVLYDLTVDLIILDQKNTHAGDIVRYTLFFGHWWLMPHFINSNGQVDLDYTALADLTGYRNSSFQLIYQLLYDGHTKPNTVILGAGSLMFLGKRFKNVFLEVLPNADTGIFDHKAVVGDPVLTGGLISPHKNRPLRTVIFKRIVDDIHQDLSQVERIADHPLVLQAGLLKRQADSLLFGLWRQDRNAVLQCIMKVERFLHFHQAPAIQLTDLKNIVYQGKQVLC